MKKYKKISTNSLEEVANCLSAMRNLISDYRNIKEYLPPLILKSIELEQVDIERELSHR